MARSSFVHALAIVTTLIVVGSSFLVLATGAGSATPTPAQASSVAPPAPAASPAPAPVSNATQSPGCSTNGTIPSSSSPLLSANGDRIVNGRLEPGGHLPGQACVGNLPDPAPAPSGVAYDGQNNTNGAIRDHTLDSNSIEAVQTVYSTRNLYPDSLTPTRWGDQLNVILSNVTILGKRAYDFWVQSLAEFDTSNNTISFYDATWNFTTGSAKMQNTSLLSWSPNSSNYTGIWLLADTPYIHVTFPFTLTLYVNSTVTAAGDQELWYNYSVLSNGHFTTDGNYDYIIFRSQAPGPQVPLTPAAFEASATTRHEVNEGYEFDTMIGPDTSSDELDLVANETIQLKYCSEAPSNDCSNTNFAYSNVPAAVNFGSQTAEGSIGLSINSVGQTAYATAGPFIEHGLWNYTTQVGWEPGFTAVANNVTVSGSPLALTTQPYIFVFFRNVGYTSQGYQFAPDVPVWYLMPGTYNYEVMLADYKEQTGNITVGNTPTTLSAVLPYSTSSGVYTPLWAFNNSQVAGISQSGAGTVSNQYLLFNNPTTATCTFCGGVTSANNLSANFYLPLNSYSSYAGIILDGTNAYINVNAPPSFCVHTAVSRGVTTYSYLSIWFYNTTHVTLSHGSAIRGWASPEWDFYIDVPGSQNMFAQGDVDILSSSDDLIMSNTFVPVVDSSGSPDSLVLHGGSGNVVWGNTFRDPPGVALGSTYGGIGEDEGGDLIYNNNFTVDNPVVWLAFNMSNDAECLPQCTGTPGSSFFYNTGVNTWNITPQSASDARVVDGFTLSGNILGPVINTEGGNYYWNYGTSPNNYTTNPYVSRFAYTDLSQVYPLGCPSIQAIGQPCGTAPKVVGSYENGMQGGSGDFAPYGPSVTFSETGLAPGTLWNITIGLSSYSTTSSSITIPEPYGLYSYTIRAANYAVSPGSGSVTANGAPVVHVVFTLITYTVTFDETGLPSGTNWSVTVGAATRSSTTSTITFQEPNGTASYTATVTGGTGGSTFHFTVNGAPISVTVPFYKATFTESGLPSGTQWSVTTNGITQHPVTTSTIFYVTNGTYPYSIGLISGYHTVDHGTFVIPGTSLMVHSTFSRTTYTVKFTETGLTSAWHTSWCVTYNSTTTCTTGSSIAFTGILNGTSYTYSIGHVANYSLNASYTGSGTISGGGGQGQIVRTVAVPWKLVKYTVTFTETGLPSHYSWQVTMNGKTTVSTGNKITFSESNGTYAFTIVSAGYSEMSNP
ncbi:MAG: thermopsin family protease, partial [Thermoplasmata archaeon]